MKQDLSALVSSRICHDLISPIGAISNGVELMTEISNDISPELSLIEESVTTAAGKVRYFRIAFGSARNDAQVSVSELRSVTGLMFQGRHSAELYVEGPNLPRKVAKALLLMLLCAERAMPLGGKIEASASDDGFTLEIQAERIAPAEDHWAMLTDSNQKTELAASEVQFLLLHYEIEAHNALLDTEFNEKSATIRLTL